MIIIAFMAPSKSGKTTCANIIQTKYPDAEIISFAAPLKELARAIGYDPYNNNKKEEARKFLRAVGDVLRRELPRKLTFNMSLTSAIVREKIKKARLSGKQLVIIDDLRYVEESLMLREEGAVIIRVNRDIPIDLTHSSETEMKEIREDYAINNIGNLTDLEDCLEALFARLTAEQDI